MMDGWIEWVIVLSLTIWLISGFAIGYLALKSRCPSWIDNIEGIITLTVTAGVFIFACLFTVGRIIDKIMVYY